MNPRNNFWTRTEVETLADGIADGLSWATIAASLPSRSNLAVRRKAAAEGLAAQSESAPYPYIPEDRNGVTIQEDRLLAALASAHEPGTAELAIKPGRPVVSHARPSSPLSLMGSAAAMAAGL